MTPTIAEAPAHGNGGRMFKPPEWEWLGFGEVGWWFRDGWGDVLLGPDGLRLNEWREEGRVTTIKSGPHRIVYRVDLPRGTIYLKHFLVPDWRATLRQWVRRGKGRNEGKRSQHLATIGVPTITPVALGEQRKRKFLFENYLVTLAISAATPLDEFVERRLPEWPEPLRSRVRRKLARDMAVMTARLHNAGLLHHDFHPGNILVRFEANLEPELVMIDLDALRKSRRVTWKLARQNLALLDHFFWLRSSRTDRHRFLKAYLQSRSELPADVRRFGRLIEDTTRIWAERLWRRWGRRCRSSNKYFQVFPGHTSWCVASRDLDPREIHSLIEDPDRPFHESGTIILKDSRTTRVAETTMVAGGRPTRVIYKRFNRKKWLDPILTLFRPSRAWRSWQAGQDLASRGIPTPRNLAFIARRRSFRSNPLSWFLPRETYLITVKEPDSVSLTSYVSEILPTLAPEVRRARIRSLAGSLALLIRCLHERSLSHRDLKASNILIKLDSVDGRDQLSLIDLVGVHLQHPLPWRRRVQNLARLCLSLSSVPERTRTDALHFLRVYLPWGLSPLGDWKGIWRSIDKAIATKRSRNLRRGRPLS
ncbi:MAG: lipopolysaccharide kinase InaA family protein [Isosphaerales bacterium]